MHSSIATEIRRVDAARLTDQTKGRVSWPARLEPLFKRPITTAIHNVLSGAFPHGYVAAGWLLLNSPRVRP